MTLRVRELDYGKLEEHIAVHLEQGTHIPKEDIEPAARMIMISVRQEVRAVGDRKDVSVEEIEKIMINEPLLMGRDKFGYEEVDKASIKDAAQSIVDYLKGEK